MEVANNRHVDSQFGQPFDNRGQRCRCGVVVYRHPHQLRTCGGQRGNLLDRTLHIRGIGIGHGLHHYRRGRAHAHIPHFDGR